MSKRLANKVAIVTGAARGIGRAIAEQFAIEDARVVIVDILEDECRALAAEINARAGGEVAAAMRLDVRDAANWQQVVALATSRFGGLDILVNNAGFLAQSDAVNCDEEEWDKVIDTNMKGPFLGIKHAVPELRKRGGGSLINIASIGGIVATHICGAYHTSKGGVRLLSKHAAVAYGPDNIRSNAICPSTIMTDMVAGLPPKLRDAAAKGTALRRFGTTEEVARAAVFLASDEAAFITGADIPVDGGITAMRPSAPAED